MEVIAFAQNYIVTFLVVLTVLVFVHEFGHYWVARRCGVRVEVFSIGFGRELFGWNDSHGTRWKVSVIPLGGYVKMYGDSDESSVGFSDEAKSMSAEQKKEAFFAKSVAQRAAIVVAGPAANYIFAIIVMTGLFMAYGQPYTLPQAGEVLAESAAAEAGMKPGDTIASIDGKAIQRFEQIQQAVALNTGTPLQFDVLREGKPITLMVTPKLEETTDAFGAKHTAARIGISKSGRDVIKHTPFSALTTAVGEAWRISSDSVKALGQMVSGTRSADELGGPLRIAQMSGSVVQIGVTELIWFMALLSISLGLLNLFPIPMLDGGHLLYYFFEAVRGKPLSDNVQEYAARGGFAFLLGIMLFATWNDLVKLEIFSTIKHLLT